MSFPIDTVEKFWSSPELTVALQKANSDSLFNFKEDLKEFLDAPNSLIEFFPSGRQALEWLLRSLSDQGSEVLTPAFNCAVVGNAVSNAGLKLKTYGFSSQVGSFDWGSVIEQLTPKTSAVIVTHYFGVPIDFRPLIDACKPLSIPIIEDCAHTLGGRIDNRKAGTLGNAAIFSFNDDKPIALGWGGAAIINTHFSTKNCIENKSKTPSFEKEEKLLKRFLKKTYLKQKLIPYYKSPLVRIAKIALNRFKKESTQNSSSQIGIGLIQAEIGRLCLQKYPSVVKTRNQNAKIFEQASQNPTWPVGSTVEPAWLRQKVFVGRSKSIDTLINSMHKRGTRIDYLNWPQLLSGTKNNSEISIEAAKSWVDVPIHQNMTSGMIENIAFYINRTK